MISSLSFLFFVICGIHNINSQLTDTEDNPVDLYQLKHVRISDTNGILNSDVTKIFPNVETLEIRNCNFTPMSQNFVNPLIHLRKLSIANSNMGREVNDIKSCCKKLREFELINSGLPSVVWDQMGSWPLEKLYLHKEKIPKLPAHVLTDSKLKDLTLEFSDLEEIDDDAFSKLVSLESLNLRNNKIKTITKKLLTPLQNVKEINLENNLLEELTTSQFPSLPNLEKLNVGHNPIKTLNLEGVKELAPKLATIDVSGIENVDLTKSGGVNLMKHSII